MFGIFKRRSAKSQSSGRKRSEQKAPGRSQIKFCERIGLPIEPGMSRADVSRMIERAHHEEPYKSRLDKYYRERSTEADRAEREQFGDAIMEELKKWDDIARRREHHLLIYKRGKSVKGDVVEFDSPEIDDSGQSRVIVNALLPKLHKERDMSDCYEWEKELALKTPQILHIESLGAEIEMFDIEGVNKAKNRATEIAARYQQ